MKSWHIFALGAAILVAGLTLLPFIAYVAVLAAVLMIAAVGVGFLLVPDRDSWQVWVTRYSVFEGEEDDIDLYSTHEPVAIRADVARLWILYIPTIAAVGFLMFMAARDIWIVNLGNDSSYVILLAARVAIGMVWLLVASWLFERWLLHQAAASQVYLERQHEDYLVSYYFTVDQEYYGGLSFPLSSYQHEPGLAQVVMFRRKNPQRNRLVRGFLFHRFEVIGRGIQDLKLARTVVPGRVADAIE